MAGQQHTGLDGAWENLCAADYTRGKKGEVAEECNFSKSHDFRAHGNQDSIRDRVMLDDWLLLLPLKRDRFTRIAVIKLVYCILI